MSFKPIKTQSGLYKIIRVLPSVNNAAFLVIDKYGKKYVYKKYPVLKSLRHVSLIDEVSFLDSSVTVVLRAPDEIIAFTKKLKKLNVCVPTIIENDTKYILEEYIEGKPLADVSNDLMCTTLIESLINSVIYIHSKGAVLGNRWVNNILVKSDNTIAYVGFDLTYDGSNVFNLEIAEVLNSLVFNRNFDVVVCVAETFIKHLKDGKHNFYNIEYICEILEKHITYWEESEEMLSSLLRVLHKKLQQEVSRK